jgi:hypothetical protein
MNDDFEPILLQPLKTVSEEIDTNEDTGALPTTEDSIDDQFSRMRPSAILNGVLEHIAAIEKINTEKEKAKQKEPEAGLLQTISAKIKNIKIR